MAAHFKQPDTPNGGAGARRAASGARVAHAGSHARRHDDAFHAPASNPHAAGTPQMGGREGFVPVMSAADTAGQAKKSGHNRRRKEARFAETDPYDLSGRRSKDPRKRVGRVLSVLLFIVGLVLIGTAAGMWIHDQWQYHEQDVINEELAGYAKVSTDGSAPPEVDWAALKAVNPEVVGWVQVPGTVVNFPVYQASDNEKYLHTNAEGVYSVGGQVFLDAENTAPGMIDAQTIIYGHHLRNGAMFKPIYDMQKQEMFDGVSTVWYVTEDATYELEPAFIYRTDGNDTNVRRFSFSSTDELHSYLTDLLGKAEAKASNAEELITGASNVLSLCTCNYDDTTSGRSILVCVPKPAASAGTAADAPAE